MHNLTSLERIVEIPRHDWLMSLHIEAVLPSLCKSGARIMLIIGNQRHSRSNLRKERMASDANGKGVNNIWDE